MRTPIVILAAGAVLATALASVDAAAQSRCDEPLYVFSRNSSNLIGSVDHNGIACRAVLPDGTHVVSDGPYDLRLINPSSDIISIRYADDDVPRRPEAIRARLNGLGFRNRTVYLTRTDITLDGSGDAYAYDSGDIFIDPNEQGCLDVDAWHAVTLKKKKRGKVVKRSLTVFRASTTYHTIDTVSC